MSTTKLLFCCFLLLTGISSIQAQDQKTSWALQECVDYAFANNLAIRRSELQVRNSEALLFQSRAGQLPTVNAFADHSYRSGRIIDPFTNQFKEQQIQSNSFGANGRLNLFSGFQQRNLIKQNQTDVEANLLGVEQSKYDVALNVALGYLQVLSTKELLAVAINQVAQSELQVQRTEKLVNAGSQPQTNLLDLQAQLALDRASLVTAQNNFTIAKLNLMQAMNLPAQSTFDVQDVPVGDPNTSDYDKNPQQIYEIAEKTLPSVKSADMRVKSSRLGLAVARGGLYPTLSLNGSINTAYSSGAPKQRYVADGSGSTKVDVPSETQYIDINGVRTPVIETQEIPNGSRQDFGYFDQLDFNLGKTVSLSLNIPIFSGWQTRTNISQSTILNKTNELDAQDIRIQLRQTIEQAYNSMLAAAATYNATREQVTALELAFRATESRFNVGLLNSVDYNLAKVNLDRARANLVSAKYDYVFRTKILDFYQNKPLSF
jgi:outer membrane protein